MLEKPFNSSVTRDIWQGFLRMGHLSRSWWGQRKEGTKWRTEQGTGDGQAPPRHRPGWAWAGPWMRHSGPEWLGPQSVLTPTRMADLYSIIPLVVWRSLESKYFPPISHFVIGFHLCGYILTPSTAWGSFSETEADGRRGQEIDLNIDVWKAPKTPGHLITKKAIAWLNGFLFN